MSSEAAYVIRAGHLVGEEEQPSPLNLLGMVFCSKGQSETGDFKNGAKRIAKIILKSRLN